MDSTGRKFLEKVFLVFGQVLYYQTNKGVTNKSKKNTLRNLVVMTEIFPWLSESR